MITTDLTTLKINKLTKAQYEAALAAGTVSENELYMTPESEAGNDVFVAEFDVTPYEDVDNAYKAGKTCFVKYTSLEPSKSYEYLSLVDVLPSNIGEPNKYYFSAYSYKWNCFFLVCLDSDGYRNDYLDILPDVTEDDAGKVLTVNDYGYWVADIVQPDWNINDETSASYVKNRPFYTGDLVETYIVQNASLTQGDGNDTIKAYVFSSPIKLTVGTKYTVYFNSTSYECVCALFDGGNVVLGNISIVGASGDTGEPFLIYTNNSTESGVYTTYISDTPSVSISILASEIVKIDEKYLPVATNDSYGVVKTDRLVTFYNFDYNVPTSLLIEAVELFNQGRAAIRWYNNDVFLASISSNSIDLMFKDLIGKYYSYDKTLETSGFYQTIDVSYIDFHTECIRFYNSEGESNIDTNIYLSNDSDNKDYLNLYSLHVYDNSVELWMYSSASGSSKVVVHKFTTDDNNLMLNGKILATEDYVNKFKPTTTITTLTASNWDSTAKTYSFESTYPSANYDIEVDIDGDRCTDEQLNAWIAAKPLSSSTNKIVAKGDIPTVDIPVILTITPK